MWCLIFREKALHRETPRATEFHRAQLFSVELSYLLLCATL